MKHLSLLLLLIISHLYAPHNFCCLSFLNNKKLPRDPVGFPVIMSSNPLSYNALIAKVKKRIEQKKNLDKLYEVLVGGSWMDFIERTPALVYFSRSDENLSLTKLLLTHGANPNACNEQGANALYNAAHYDQIETVKVLLQYQVNPNKKNTPRLSLPLQEICARDILSTQALQIVQLLLAHRANPNISNCFKRTPLFSCLVASDFHRDSEEKKQYRNQQQKLIKILIRYRANIWQKDKNSETAIKFARKKHDLYFKKLADYTEHSYALWHLLCCRQALRSRKSSSPLRIFPKDLLNLIAEKTITPHGVPIRTVTN